jgi:hypothetical protein
LTTELSSYNSAAKEAASIAEAPFAVGSTHIASIDGGADLERGHETQSENGRENHLLEHSVSPG